MSKKICFDGGHGGGDTGASYQGRVESVITLNTVLECERLAKLNGFDVVMTRRSNSTVSLSERVAISNSNGVDLFVSIHVNATVGATGTETYVANSCSDTSRSCAKIVQASLVKEFGLKDRGVKSANFYVIKETNAPAILCECGFIENELDMSRITSNNYARAVVRGICELYGIAFKEVGDAPQVNTEVFYRVCVGSFNDINNAKIKVEELKSKGYSDTFIAIYNK